MQGSGSAELCGVLHGSTGFSEGSDPMQAMLVNLGCCWNHTSRSVKLPLFRHFQDRFLMANREKREEKRMALCLPRFWFLMFGGPFASHDSNPHPNRTSIARYTATKFFSPSTILAENVMKSSAATLLIWTDNSENRHT